MKLIIFFFIIIFFSNFSFAVEFKGKFEQGSFILGKTNPKSQVIVDEKKIRVSKDGYFAFGLGRDRKNDVIIKVINNKKLEIFEKKVFKKEYKIQRIDGLPKKQVTPPKEVYDRIRKDNILIGKAREIDTQLDYFKNKFIKPLDKAIITGVYGSQRILNGKPKWPHYGIDIAAKKGTPIKASGTGVVTMAENDLYYTGGTIIMDHGHGISTIYSHLENVMVNVGDLIKQGDIIGTVGSTGRSTGPHLDFRVNWFQTRLDPMTVIQ